jgi:hypothetical protein
MRGAGGGLCWCSRHDSWRCACLVAIALVAAGCVGNGTKTSQSRGGPSASVPTSATAEAANVDRGDFAVADNMLDTWNTIGQILMHLDGVEYESRAQMLGIYALRYRGERFLIRTQAMVIQDPTAGIQTRVSAMDLHGKARSSAASVQLLRLLRERVPLEIGKYRQPIRIKASPIRKRAPAQRSSSGSLPVLSSQSLASGGGSLRVVITGQALASSAFSAT